VTRAAVGLVAAGLVAAALSTGGGRHQPVVAAPAPKAVCTPLPYLPCGASVPAPHTNGVTCDPGWYDLDGLAADGCEAHSDYLAGTTLVPGLGVHANVVPASAQDSFLTHVDGDAFDLCWGALHVTLVAPPHAAEELTVWKGATRVAGTLSANGAPGTVAVDKPSCFGADSEELRVTVTAVAVTGGASARNFTLTRDGGW
jgi:hypothetical protein